jgi:hypothetical protein
MLVTVKSREVQRAVQAEMRGDRKVAQRHFRAAAHLELVLADDYALVGEPDLSLRSRLSAASCLWRAGEFGQARRELDTLIQELPERAEQARQVLADLQANFPENQGT